MPRERRVFCLKFTTALLSKKSKSLNIPSTVCVYIGNYTTWKISLLLSTLFLSAPVVLIKIQEENWNH